MGEWRPASEKESGVRFRMAMMWVWRLGSSAFSGGRCWEMGVVVDKAVGEEGRAFRWARKGLDERGLGRDSCGIRLMGSAVELKITLGRLKRQLTRKVVVGRTHALA